MKNNVLKFVLVLSLLLNTSLLASAGYTHYKQSRPRPFPLGTAVQHSTDGTHHLFEELSLSPDQLTAMQQRALTFHADLEKKAQEVERKRRYLVAVMGAGVLDEKAIDSTIGEISRLQEEIQRMAVSHMLEVKSMLDNNQQKKFFDLIHAAMANRREMQCP